jgi:hypothetical protein
MKEVVQEFNQMPHRTRPVDRKKHLWGGLCPKPETGNGKVE